MTDESKTVSWVKSRDLEIFLELLPLATAANVLKRCEKEVPSVTTWLKVQLTKTPSASSVTRK